MTKLQKNWLEWLIFAIGFILLVSTFGYLVYDAATIHEAPPQIVVTLGKAKQGIQNFIVPVSVTNQGDQTAEDVQIEVVLEKSDRQEELASFQIAFLPRRAIRKGWVTFETDPQTAKRMKARAVGYQKP
ncbi:MAG TPA: hypothetical protein V6D28_20250 [Leptolyngbyaceae cyanobacterium]